MHKRKIITIVIDYFLAILNIGVGIYLFKSGTSWWPLFNFFVAGWAMAFGTEAIFDE